MLIKLFIIIYVLMSIYGHFFLLLGLVVEMSVDYYSCLGEGVRDGGRLNMGVMNTNGRLRTKVPKYEKMPVP